MSLLFIKGVSLRTGTNYLQYLLNLHPACVKPRYIGEDHLLQHLPELFGLVEALSNAWRPYHDERYRSAKEELRRYLLGAIESFVWAQAGEEAEVLVLKTPNTVGLENYTWFPGAKALVICRDGRDAVESAVNTGWPDDGSPWTEFEHAAQSWRNGVRALQAAREKQVAFSLVRYEDLVLNTRPTLVRLFEELGLGRGSYDFSQAENAPVIGSAFIPGDDGKTVWKPKAKPQNFSPVERWRRSWDEDKLDRFLEICGPEMTAMGYDVSLRPDNTAENSG